jgi:mono/diheme cytochrome c family protein
MRSASAPSRASSSRLRGGAAAIVLAWAFSGCGTPAALSTPAQRSGAWPAASGDAPGRAHIVAVYQSHCGACHRPVAPGSEPAARLEATLMRHRKRTRLTEQEWTGLGEFLAGSP